MCTVSFPRVSKQQRLNNLARSTELIVSLSWEEITRTFMEPVEEIATGPHPEVNDSRLHPYNLTYFKIQV